MSDALSEAIPHGVSAAGDWHAAWHAALQDAGLTAAQIAELSVIGERLLGAESSSPRLRGALAAYFKGWNEAADRLLTAAQAAESQTPTQELLTAALHVYKACYEVGRDPQAPVRRMHELTAALKPVLDADAESRAVRGCAGLALSEVQCTDLARAVLAWHRDGLCRACGGHGFKLAGSHALGEGRAVLSDAACDECRGTRKVPFNTQFPMEQLWLARTPAQAIERLKAAGSWSLVIADFQLGAAISGLALLQQIGAAMPGSYFSATAKWVGLVTTTVAFLTALSIRRRTIWRWIIRMRALICGEPSDALCSSLISCFVIFSEEVVRHRWTR